MFLGLGQIWCENRRPEYERLQAQTNPHSPGRYRVNGVVSNMPEFQKAFGCKPDAPMVREARAACGETIQHAIIRSSVAWPSGPTRVVQASRPVTAVGSRAANRLVRALPAAARLLPAASAREKRRAFRDETYWARPVPGFGDPRARLLIVGLAPAAHGANRTGRVFTGDGVGGSGDFLMAALHRAGFANIPTSRHADDGLQLSDAFIAAAVRCAPPDNKPTPEEIASCLPHLDAELAALPRVRVIVALGRIAFRRLPAAAEDARRRASAPRPQFAHGRDVDLGRTARR